MFHQDVHKIDDTVLAEVAGGGLLALIKVMIGWDSMVKAYEEGYKAGQY